MLCELILEVKGQDGGDGRKLRQRLSQLGVHHNNDRDRLTSYAIDIELKVQ